MIDYAEIAAGALESLQEAGAVLSLSVSAPSVYDPSTAGVTAAPTSYSVAGVVLPAGAINGSGFQFAADVMVAASQLVLLAAPGLSVVPAPGNVLTVPSGPLAGAWRVIGSDTLAPAGVPVLHGLAVVR